MLFFRKFHHILNGHLEIAKLCQKKHFCGQFFKKQALHQIDLKEAQDLFNLCEEGIIEKYRYLVKENDHTFEVDEFLGENNGLIVAEIELEEENEKFSTPNWLGKEVTGIVEYYNSNLSKLPFSKW